ncbi:hypothetical protein C0J52_19337 [Blattella germanica]|nr:hypothetical protein C0J52_19337 [Blattella germanica]
MSTIHAHLPNTLFAVHRRREDVLNELSGHFIQIDLCNCIKVLQYALRVSAIHKQKSHIPAEIEESHLGESSDPNLGLLTRRDIIRI